MNETVTGTGTCVKHGRTLNHFDLKHCRRGCGCQGRTERHYNSPVPAQKPTPHPIHQDSMLPPHSLCCSITVLVVSFLFTGAQSFPHSSCLLYRLEPHGLPQRDANIQWPEIPWFVSFLGGCLTSKAAVSLHQLTQGRTRSPLELCVAKAGPRRQNARAAVAVLAGEAEIAHLIPLMFQWGEFSPEPHLTAGSREMWFLGGQMCAQKDRIKRLWTLGGTITSLPHVLYSPFFCLSFSTSSCLPLSASPSYQNQP